MSSGSIRQPPPGAAVACQSSSKPSSGVGPDAAAGRCRRRRGRDPRAPGAPGVARDRLAGVDLDQVADHPEARGARRLHVARAGRPASGSCCRPRTAAAASRHTPASAASRARRAQQVHRDSRARACSSEAVAVQRRLPAALHPAEDDRLHASEVVPRGGADDRLLAQERDARGRHAIGRVAIARLEHLEHRLASARSRGER